jgi:hypothetical protein
MVQKGLRVGAGKAVICFPEEYFPHEGFSGGHDDIHVRVLLLETELRAAIFSVELPSIRPFSLIDGLRQYAGSLLDVPPEQVWFVVTHNVSAPHVPDAATPEGAQKQTMHLDALRRAMSEAAQQALETFRPARMGIGSGLCNVNCNRDIPSKEGWWLGVNAPGPSDKTVSVLRFDGLDGTPIGVIYHYAVKTAIVDDEYMSDGSRHYTDDLTGRACRYVEAQTGAVTLYLMGAAGDQVPQKVAKYFKTDAQGHLQEVHHREKGYEWVEELGTVLGQSVLSVVNQMGCTQTTPIFTMQNLSMAFQGQYPVPRELAHQPVLEYSYIPKADTILQISLLRLDELVMVGVKPEYTCITGIQLRENSPFAHTLLVSMVNGGQGYMADQTAYARMTYESTHSEYACGSAEHFVDRMGRVLALTKEGTR